MEKKPPANYINPRDFGTLGLNYHNDIAQALRDHDCSTIVDFIDSIRVDFLDGVSLGKDLQANLIFHSEKPIVNALSHPFWLVSKQYSHMVFSEMALKNSFNAIQAIYLCTKCRKPFGGKLKLYEHAAQCTHLKILTENLRAFTLS